MSEPETISKHGGLEPGLIHARGLSIGYGKPLMEGLDFTVRRGEVFLVLGGSGTGKSTLLKTLFGRLAPVAGSVEIAGVGDPSDLKGQRPRFGVSFQSGRLGTVLASDDQRDALLGSITDGQPRRTFGVEPENRRHGEERDHRERADHTNGEERKLRASHVATNLRSRSSVPLPNQVSKMLTVYTSTVAETRLDTAGSAGP